VRHHDVQAGLSRVGTTCGHRIAYDASIDGNLLDKMDADLDK
jgi:hypothetical protein